MNRLTRLASGRLGNTQLTLSSSIVWSQTYDPASSQDLKKWTHSINDVTCSVGRCRIPFLKVCAFHTCEPLASTMFVILSIRFSVIWISLFPLAFMAAVRLAYTVTYADLPALLLMWLWVASGLPQTHEHTDACHIPLTREWQNVEGPHESAGMHYTRISTWGTVLNLGDVIPYRTPFPAPYLPPFYAHTNIHTQCSLCWACTPASSHIPDKLISFKGCLKQGQFT